MDRIKSHRIAYLVFLITGFIGGLLVGTTLVTLLVGHKLDIDCQRINDLESAIKEKDIRLEKLEKSINNKKFILRNISVVMQFQGDAMDKAAIEQYIKERYYTLLGKEVKTIDADIASEVINNRILHINDKAFKLSITKLIVAEEFKIWLTVSQLN